VVSDGPVCTPDGECKWKSVSVTKFQQTKL
jgi:hypothetical protein